MRPKIIHCVNDLVDHVVIVNGRRREPKPFCLLRNGREIYGLNVDAIIVEQFVGQEFTLADLGDVASDWLVVSRDLENTTVTLTDFDVGRDYLYRVRARNTVGLSEPSMVASYHAKTGEHKIFRLCLKYYFKYKASFRKF